MALHEDPRISLHVELDERSAGFLALGIAKSSGAPAVVVTTSGTATANLYPAVVEADAAAVPLIALTADRPPELRGTGANQTIDQVKLYGDRVRWFTEIGVAEDRPGAVAYWRSVTCRLWGEASGMRGVPGPVHANVPTREPTVPLTDDGRNAAQPFLHQLDGRRGREPWTQMRVAPRAMPDAELSALAQKIATTERGVIVVGDSATPLGSVIDLARAAGWPVIAEPLGGSPTLRGFDQVIGTAALLLADHAFAERHRPELAVRIGRQGLARGVGALLGADVPQILIDGNGTWLDPGRALSQIVVADPLLTCASLARQLGVAASSDWFDGWRDADKCARAAMDSVLDAEAAICEPRVARDVVAAVPDGGTLVVSSSMPVRDLDAFMGTRGRVRVLANRGASGIDGVVSTMLGVALGSGGAPVVGLLGDLALLHDAVGFGLRAGVDRVDLTLVVVNNDGGGIFSFLPQADHPLHFETVFGTPHGRDIGRLAALHEVPHVLVDDPTGLVRTVRDGIADGGIRLIEVRTDRRRNVDVHRELQEAVSAALR